MSEIRIEEAQKYCDQIVRAVADVFVGDTTILKKLLAASLANVAGLKTFRTDGGHEPVLVDTGINRWREENGLRGLWFTCESSETNELHQGSLALVTAEPRVTWKREWLRTGWWDGAQEFWDDFCADGRLQPETYR